MIINTGGRTDTVQYYSDWLLRRFAEGYVLSRNPLFPDKVTRYELTPDKVDCVVFCSKNYKPILPRLREITDRFPAYFYYTITAYGKDVEPGVPSIEESIETLKELSALVGRERVAWRYDPVLLTREYTIRRHLDTFPWMARELAPYIDRCIFSFVEMYKKLETNMPEILPMSETERDALARAGSRSGEAGDGDSDLRDKWRLYPLWNPGVGLHNSLHPGKGQPYRVSQFEAQGHAGGLPLHGEPGYRSLRYLPERMQILLCQQESEKGL